MQAIKIPIWLAIIININIVVGVGFFLEQRAGVDELGGGVRLVFG